MHKEEAREVMAFAVQGGGGNRKATSNGKEKQTPARTICKRRGHEAENCFQSIGYPDWWGDRPRTVSRGGGRSGRGGSTGGRGCGGLPRANVAQGLSAQATVAAAQDRTSRTVIGAGEQRDGLYYLVGETLVTAHKASGVASFDLWHRRMGHPSNKVVGMLSDVVGHHIGVSGNKICDVCVRAKQTRESFLLSE
ncbi:hypothetical protein MRB53_006652 [Persea americana]|uniref:Uncharacterized protein n=1 Tax=Persea americana TaxID=3435 RepID=A0ACC2MGS6_PERAE|nr:hypothetical protein MRB53_006652 [Persea americana]